ncbi:MAG: phosphotyrosine protein phosphatase [Nitrosomonadaceae bacterium]|nr:phosphotyrosine protein phosphatase [Nitrosomonadaceae bacterium]|tara:strand:+ start:570 stop:1058 length:489 start_codon:yes stop_codon:yes gene_type:complete
MIKVLFVCMGNICRSPTAEAVFRHQAETSEAGNLIFVDSAGTHSYHIGEPPDERAQKIAKQHGYDMKNIRARQFKSKDFNTFQYILAMDKHNFTMLNNICPPQHSHKLEMFMQHSTNFTKYKEVPDPYFGGHKGFEKVLKLIEDASAGLLQKINTTHNKINL